MISYICIEACFLHKFFEKFTPELRQSFAGAAVSIPAAAWLLGSGLIGLVAIRSRMKK